MTIDELKEFKESNSDEFQELIKGLGFESEDDVTGLKSKRDELLRTNRQLKNSLKDAEKKISSIDLDEYEALRESAANVDSTKADRESKRLQELVKSEQDRASGLELALNETLIKNELSKAFDINKVDSIHKSMLTNAYLGKAKVENDNGRRTVYIDDGNAELPAGDFFKQWVDSDNGKPYLAKATNHGAGDKNFNASNNTISRTDFDSLSHMDKAATVKNGTKII